jgi:D-psicose/D-tagatose/L-ribulose 3-epimerase
MKLGVHASAWCERWDDSALYTIDRVKDMGLDFIEIPLMNLDGINVNTTKRKLQDADLEVVTSTLITNEKHDITSDDPKIRRAGTDYLKQCVKYSSEIGASLFTGVIYALHLKSLPKRPTDDLLQMVAEILKEVAQYASDRGVTIGIEPINRYETFLINTCSQALTLKRMIGEPNVIIHLDTYHMNMEEKNLEAAVRDAGEDLGHIHLNENDWGIPGTGHIEWNGIFRALSDLEYQGYASLECVVDFQGNFVWRQLAPDSQTLVEQGVKFMKDMRKMYITN